MSKKPRQTKRDFHMVVIVALTQPSLTGFTATKYKVFSSEKKARAYASLYWDSQWYIPGTVSYIRDQIK